MKKGNLVYIEGKLKTRSWEDKEGNTRYTTEVVADNMTMLGGKPSEASGEEGFRQETKMPVTETTGPDLNAVNDDTDDLPF